MAFFSESLLRLRNRPWEILVLLAIHPLIQRPSTLANVLCGGRASLGRNPPSSGEGSTPRFKPRPTTANGKELSAQPRHPEATGSMGARSDCAVGEHDARELLDPTSTHPILQDSPWPHSARRAHGFSKSGLAIARRVGAARHGQEPLRPDRNAPTLGPLIWISLASAPGYRSLAILNPRVWS